jgi:hypothetical protein
MEEKLTAEEMQEIILRDALKIVSKWRNHPYDKEPSIEYYDILNHLRYLMKKLRMDKEENLVRQAYAQEILKKKTSFPEKSENMVFRSGDGGGN